MTTPLPGPHSAWSKLWALAPLYAKAKAEQAYIEEFRKSKKAILMRESSEKTSAAKEAAAYADPEYLELLDGLKAAVEAAEKLRWQLVACQQAIEIWRSTEASNRAIDRGAR